MAPSENLSNQQPTLSILCQGRNDSYMGNFTWRLSTVLNKHAENIILLGLEAKVELLVSDWGSEQPLYNVLELSEHARKLVRYLVTPPEIARQYDKDAGFSVPHAINALARRSHGRYVMFSDSDVYLPLETMAKLMYYLDLGYFHSFNVRNSFFWASKYHIPNDYIADSPYREHLEQHIMQHGYSYLHEKVDTKNFMGCGVCLLMSRDMWFESTGWDERLIYMGWNDIDFTKRLMFKYRWDDLESHGMTFYHLEHYRDRFNPNYAHENKKKLNPYNEPTTISPNPSNWGLADHALSFVDGFGQLIHDSEPLLSSRLSTFDTTKVPQTVRQMTSTNPLYRTVAERFEFEQHSWFTNAEAVQALLAVLQPKTVCEIGSWMGASARCFATHASVEQVFCIDHWDRTRVEKYQPGIHPEHLMNNMYEQFLANAVHSGTDSVITPIRLDSDAAADYCLANGITFDLIYVDGDHTTVGARSDILKWAPLLNKGGYICGDDWAWQTEPDNVAGAVISVAQEKGWQIYYYGNFWLAISGPYCLQQLSYQVLQTIKPVHKPAEKADSELNNIIAPEIKNDELYNLIIKLASEEDIKNVLEIGSSAGGGSTEAFVTGLQHNPNNPVIFCMEVSRPRCDELKKRYAEKSFVKCYNTSSVPLAKFPAKQQVESFYFTHRTILNGYPLEQVLGWLQQDIEYVAGTGVDENGIARIKQDNGLDHFDLVLIDGSEFTGKAELEEVYGARWILLDDVNAYKNYENYHLLKKDPDYELYQENWDLRNGYAVFRKKEGELPVHFFTIVLNGMPFIGHHIDVFRHLPFKWHWHIVEGVADLVGDTAWSKPSGGHIADSQHQNGLSIDGTTEYIDEISKMFPDNITVYRKEQGIFWHGKNEMVNAPLANITEECLLWQVDVDEFWKYEQIVTSRDIFLRQPAKTAAFYWCHFFVGKDIVVASRNCYSENPAFEWLRTWRYLPGDQWAAHEPPRLHRGATEHSAGIDVSGINPLVHAETEASGLVFQHFAYVLAEQLKFKESYYGYHGAYYQWLNLQKQNRFPQLLRDYFSWVQDNTTVTSARTAGILPEPLPSVKPGNQLSAGRPFNIVIDGVFLQLAQSGIARVWLSLLEQWKGSRFARHLHILDRGRTFPRIDGYHYLDVPTHDYNNLQNDRNMLQDICDTLKADLFVSTYYTTPLRTPSLLMVHDMIPEVFLGESRLAVPMWIEKQHALSYASEYVAVSNNTAHDLVRLEPSFAYRPIHVVHNGVSEDFKPAGERSIEKFCSRHSIHKPYYLFSGFRGTYKNFEFIMKTVSTMSGNDRFVIVTTGSPELEPEFHQYVNSGHVVNVGWLSSEDLKAAYSGAIALLYPSLYEGFGLPILEAMRCGCPVITSNYGAMKEISGDAAYLINPTDPEELKTALSVINKQHIREYFINKGYEHVQMYSWKRSASGILRIMTRMVGGNEGSDNLILEKRENR